MFDKPDLTREADLWQLANVAEVLGCTEAEVQEAIHHGLLPVVPPQVQVLIHDADLEAFIEAGGLAQKRPRKKRRFFFPFLSG